MTLAGESVHIAIVSQSSKTDTIKEIEAVGVTAPKRCVEFINSTEPLYTERLVRWHERQAIQIGVASYSIIVNLMVCLKFTKKRA